MPSKKKSQTINEEKRIVHTTRIVTDSSEISRNLSDFDFVQIDEKIFDTKFENKPIGYFQDVWIRFRKNKASVTAFVIIVTIAILSIICPMISGYTYREQKVTAASLPPRIPGLEKLGIFNGYKTLTVQKANIETRYKDSYIRTISEHEIQGVEMAVIEVNAYILQGIPDQYYLFGTDTLGRDLFTRVWRGVRMSLLLAILATIGNILIGVIYGAISGYYGGWIDTILQRIAEIIGGIPTISVLMLTIMYLGGPSFKALLISFYISGWIGVSSVTRIQFYRNKNREYVLASKTMGANDKRLMIKHIFPNAAGTLITSIALMIPSVIMSESTLAYLGLGITPPESALGILLLDGQSALLSYPHIIVPPAIIISLLMISFNLLGNGLRDAFDPTLRGV